MVNSSRPVSLADCAMTDDLSVQSLLECNDSWWKDCKRRKSGSGDDLLDGRFRDHDLVLNNDLFLVEVSDGKKSVCLGAFGAGGILDNALSLILAHAQWARPSFTQRSQLSNPLRNSRLDNSMSDTGRRRMLHRLIVHTHRLIWKALSSISKHLRNLLLLAAITLSPLLHLSRHTMIQIEAEGRVMFIAWMLHSVCMVAEVVGNVANACRLTLAVKLHTDWGREDGAGDWLWFWTKRLAGLGGAERGCGFGESGAGE